MDTIGLLDSLTHSALGKIGHLVCLDDARTIKERVDQIRDAIRKGREKEAGLMADLLITDLSKLCFTWSIV